MSIKDEVVHVFRMFFWTMVSLFMHLGLIMVGAWVTYEIPGIDHETRTWLFLSWMAVQFLTFYYLGKKL